MALVTFTLQDDENGGVTLKVESDPPFSGTGSDTKDTDAQVLAGVAFSAVAAVTGIKTDEEVPADDAG